MKVKNAIVTVGKVLAAAVVVSLAFGASAANVQSRQLKFGHFSTEDTPLGLGAYKFAELVLKKSDGKIQVKVYNSGQLGSEVQQLGAMQSGSQDFAMISSSPLVSVVRELQVLDFPGLLDSPELADKLLDGPIGNQMLTKFQEKNLVGLSYWENGFRQFTNSKRRIKKVEDFSGLKVRVIQNPIYIDMFKELKTNPVPMSFTQLYTALETRTVDGQDNAMATSYMARFSEVQKYLTLTRHIYNPMVVVGSKKLWDSMSADERKILTDSLAEARDYMRKVNRQKEQYYIDEMRKSGMIVDEFPAAEAQKMKDMMKPVIAKYTKEVGEPFVKQVYAEVERLKAGK